MFLDIKDFLIRKVATSFLLSWADGYKTEIMRVVQAINMVLLAFVTLCPNIHAVAACGVIAMLNTKWIALGVLAGHFGLELGIQDANAKERQGN